MKTYTAEELNEKLKSHAKWLKTGVSMKLENGHFQINIAMIYALSVPMGYIFL